MASLIVRAADALRRPLADTMEVRVLSARTEPAKGSPRNPMTYDEVADKFRTNADFAKWPKAKAESTISQVQTLEAAPNMARLTAALSA